MKRWFYKMEYKYGNYCIHNLMLTIILGQVLVYLADSMMPQMALGANLALFWPAVMQGEVWRLLTFLFVPPAASPLFLLLVLYCDYLIGHTLETTWGDFKFNAYYLIGILGAILTAVLTGYAGNLFLNLSLFFAFAVLYPDMQFLLFFIIPVKVKWLALASGAYYVFSIVVGSWQTKLSIVFSLAAFLLFFGSDLLAQTRRSIAAAKTRAAWKKNNRK